MKRCFKCGREKPLADFYRDPRMVDGHLGKCKACTKTDVAENRERRRDRYLAYERERTKRPERVAAIRRSQQRHHDRYLARVAVHNATQRGKLAKKPCEVCTSPKAEAHHDDYTQPLAVRWLCRKHHAEADKQIREGQLAPF